MSANPFADWSSDVFTAGRLEYFLATNTATLYSVVFPARGIKRDAGFRSNMFAQLRAAMIEDGFEFHYRRLVDVESDAVNYSRALSKGIIGSMNDLAEIACYCLEMQDKSPAETTRSVNEMSFSIIGGVTPREAFQHLSFRG